MGCVRNGGGNTYLVSETNLEYRPILLCQFPRDFCMFVSELQETSEERVAGYFRQVFDFRRVCSVEVADEEIDESYQRDSGCLGSHDYGFSIEGGEVNSELKKE